MTAPSGRALIIGLFLLTLVFHLAIAWQDFGVLAKNGFLYDDSFYAFKIAQNIAMGRGATFDGVHSTNGFQPLYVLLLVPVFWLTGGDLVTPVHVALTLSALFTALTAALLFLLLRRYVSARVGVLASVIWAFSPVAARQTANGLETSLALLLFASVVYFYVSRIRSVESPARRSYIIIGVLVGLALLARVDEIFLGLAILLDYLLVLRRRRAPSRVLPNVLTALATCAVVYSPWLVFNWMLLGNVLQDGGAATRFLSIAYAPFFELGSKQMIDDGPTAKFLWGHIVHAFAVLKVTPPVHALFRGIEKVDLWLGMAGTLKIIGNVIGLGALAFVVYRLGFRKKGALAAGLGEIRFLLLFAVLLIASYSLYVFGVFFFIRYFYPVYFIACIYTAFLLQALFNRLEVRAPRMRTLAATGFAVYLAVFAFMTYTCAFRSVRVYYFYDVAHWVNEHTSDDEVIGVFQGGAIGYLSDRKVINLDGKVNRQALAALKDHRLAEYLEEEGVDVIMDNSNVLSLFLGGKAQRVATMAGCDQIMNGTKDGVPGWMAYRITAPLRANGTGSMPSSLSRPSGNR
jgi:hypothetical protein